MRSPSFGLEDNLIPVSFLIRGWIYVSNLSLDMTKLISFCTSTPNIESIVQNPVFINSDKLEQYNETVMNYEDEIIYIRIYKEIEENVLNTCI